MKKSYYIRWGHERSAKPMTHPKRQERIRRASLRLTIRVKAVAKKPDC